MTRVDSTAFLDWFEKPMPSWGIYEFYRQQVEAMVAAERGEEVKPLKHQPLDLAEVYRGPQPVEGAVGKPGLRVPLVGIEPQASMPGRSFQCATRSRPCGSSR
jgi:hypothetical protein